MIIKYIGGDTFILLLKMCEALPRLHVGAFFSSQKKFEEKKEDIAEQFEYSFLEQNHVAHMAHYYHEIVVRFTNGSLIRIMVAKPSVRGFRYHVAACDTDIESELMTYNIRPCGSLVYDQIRDEEILAK